MNQSIEEFNRIGFLGGRSESGFVIHPCIVSTSRASFHMTFVLTFFVFRQKTLNTEKRTIMNHPIVHRHYLCSMRIVAQVLMVLSSCLRARAFSSIATTSTSNPLGQVLGLPLFLPKKSSPSSIQLSMKSLSTKPTEDDDLDKWQRMYE